MRPAQRLFDLPDAPRPSAEAPAPPRLLPGFDNLLFAWKDRSRVISEEHRRRLSAPPLMHPSFLLDGFVAGEWRIEKREGPDNASRPKNAGQPDPRNRVQLVIEPYVQMSNDDEEALAQEGEDLLRFLEPDAQACSVQVQRP